MKNRYLAFLCFLLLIVIISLCFFLSPRDSGFQADASRTSEVRSPSQAKTYVVLRKLPDESRASRPAEPQRPHSAPLEKTVAGVREVEQEELDDQKATAAPQEEVRANLSAPPHSRGPGEPASPVKPALSIDKSSYAGKKRDVGRSLLGIDGKEDGTVPMITMDYRRHLGWPGYVKAMLKFGGLFFIYDNSSGRICAEADVLNSKITAAQKYSLTGMSPRVREIHSEIAISGLMQNAEKMLGQGEYSLVLLLPLNIDFDIVGGIAQAITDKDIDFKSLRRVSGEYELKNGRLYMHATMVSERDGTSRPVDVMMAM